MLHLSTLGFSLRWSILLRQTMRTVLFLCAVFALKVATAAEPVKEKLDVQQNNTKEGRPVNPWIRRAETMAKERPRPSAMAKERPRPSLQTRGMMLDDRYLRHDSCLPGWYTYGSRCFCAFPTPMNWTEAETACLYFGANLASIHNPGENEFIQYIILEEDIYDPVWIGGSDAIMPGKWFWSDGSVFYYTNWIYYDQWEHCTAMISIDDGQWVGNYCEEQSPFVCGTRPHGPT
uniref:galactose-specific lectin nattectin-like isoform X2 n=1 Tax=Monopterus albus TaxID=43700 RepID=UPI0009B3B404|nr:galactose-specific lectin nattectin-like isoform X2 [Monopterus albus]